MSFWKLYHLEMICAITFVMTLAIEFAMNFLMAYAVTPNKNSHSLIIIASIRKFLISKNKQVTNINDTKSVLSVCNLISCFYSICDLPNYFYSNIWSTRWFLLQYMIYQVVYIAKCNLSGYFYCFYFYDIQSCFYSNTWLSLIYSNIWFTMMILSNMWST